MNASVERPSQRSNRPIVDPRNNYIQQANNRRPITNWPIRNQPVKQQPRPWWYGHNNNHHNNNYYWQPNYNRPYYPYPYTYNQYPQYVSYVTPAIYNYAPYFNDDGLCHVNGSPQELYYDERARCYGYFNGYVFVPVPNAPYTFHQGQHWFRGRKMKIKHYNNQYYAGYNNGYINAGYNGRGWNVQGGIRV